MGVCMDYNSAKEIFKNIKEDLTQEQYLMFEQYKKLLLEYNEHTNLTAIVEEQDIWIKHFADSCLLLKYIKPDSSLIDVGTGAGFPGIPVKIMNPSVNVSLIDSLNKRVIFLEDVVKSLNLGNIKCYHGRAESFANLKNYREQFDVVTARAVANLSTLSEYCLPFVKVGGIFICMKGSNYEEELKQGEKAIDLLGGKIENIDEFELPIIKDKRAIIIIRKISDTPSMYPRKEGVPSKNPL